MIDWKKCASGFMGVIGAYLEREKTYRVRESRLREKMLAELTDYIKLIAGIEHTNPNAIIGDTNVSEYFEIKKNEIINLMQDASDLYQDTADSVGEAHEQLKRIKLQYMVDEQ